LPAAVEIPHKNGSDQPMKYCCEGFEHAVSKRMERGISIGARDTGVEPIIYIIGKAIDDVDLPRMLKNAKVLREAGVSGGLFMSIESFSPIRFCPWCGVKLHKFYVPTWRELPRVV
jgi:hypothetical protein